MREKFDSTWLAVFVCVCVCEREREVCVCVYAHVHVKGCFRCIQPWMGRER